ncbi:MAG TPA: polyprenyl synthetase family protein, partial [Verrucomicrobiae bacterium]|nr:polyprenyl synthetase family protein [Verrucomicrobiae bacterium]
MQNALAFKKRFDPVLRRLLVRKTKEMSRLTADRHVAEVIGHAGKLLLSGGKRVRPYLAWLAYREAGGKKDVLEILAGLELFHAFALVHDDIMDRGMERHGVATTHRLYGDGQAILLGDLLFNWAYELIAPTPARDVFARMVDEVILGQMLDVDAVNRKKVSEQFLEEKMRLKTASYTFVRPMQFGVALAQGEKRKAQRMMEFCERFGWPLGLAFQIQDDLLDLVGDAKTLGKRTMNDVSEGQKTVFSAGLERYKGKKLSAKDRKDIRAYLEKSGNLARGIKRMKDAFDQAEREAKGRVPFL